MTRTWTLWIIAGAVAALVFGWGIYVLPVQQDVGNVRADNTRLHATLQSDQRTICEYIGSEQTRKKNAETLNLKASTLASRYLEAMFLAELASFQPRVAILSTFTDQTFQVVPHDAATPTPNPSGTSAPSVAATPSSSPSLPSRPSPALLQRAGTLTIIGHERDILDVLAHISRGPLLIEFTGSSSLQPVDSHDDSANPILTLHSTFKLYRVQPAPTPSMSPVLGRQWSSPDPLTASCSKGSAA